MEDINRKSNIDINNLNKILNNWSNEYQPLVENIKSKWGRKINKKAIFVCKRGGVDDGNVNGTVFNPVRTISKAQELANHGDVIVLRGQDGFNEHYFDETNITKQIMITNFPQETPILDGTKSVKDLRLNDATNWELETKNIVRDDNVKQVVSLYKIKLKAGTRVWQCFHNREEIINARYPSAQWNDDSVYEINSDERPTRWGWGYDKNDPEYYDVYNPGEIIDHPHDQINLRTFVEKQQEENSSFTINDALINVNVGSFKTYTKKVIKTDLLPSNKIKLTYFNQAPEPEPEPEPYETNEPEPEQQPKLWEDDHLWKTKHHHYYLENKLEFLNSQNEWFYDTSDNYLYVRLFNDDTPSLDNIRLKTQSYVLNITSSDVIVKGIKFFATTFKGLRSHNLLVSDCDFLYPSCYAHMLNEINENSSERMNSLENEVFDKMTKIISSRNCKIFKCSFKFTDGSGLETSGSTVNEPNVLEDCYFSYIDKTCANLVSVMTSIRLNGYGNIIKHNTFLKTGASSTINPGNQAIVEYNDLSRSGYLQSDGAMIHCMVAQQENIKIRYNYVHDSIKYGIRFDGDGEGYSGYIHHNIGLNCEGGIMVKGGELSGGVSVGGHFVFNNTVFNTNLTYPQGKNDIIVINTQKGVPINHGSIVLNNLSARLSGHRTEIEEFEDRIIHSNNFSVDGLLNITDASGANYITNINSVVTDIENNNFIVPDTTLNRNYIINKGLTTHANTYINANLTRDIGALVNGETPFTAGITWSTGTRSTSFPALVTGYIASKYI